jgi:hypothetical protein
MKSPLKISIYKLGNSSYTLNFDAGKKNKILHHS